ncbi:hypothetical protein AUEXF2481DRAFT_24710 [Aureobasidium subglaciale EXF-2481]|uniref:Uncharacterized protein n=1 Tax=Aureobasidium subglaciale (strain EXF-2481) TaxID=1043005 RepID=A0A074YW48_AURSE|nr:uncharacterized protein AUEXF2481DRAFT_24710 [Aureobasidium subglaciale EXF-2481]KER00375.1 hypothetical protein AUEXF2481DRAFT_24710 [Aureobasidium subglaciale EXF-2481]
MSFAFTFTASVASPVLSATSVATTVYATPHTTNGLSYDAMDIDAIISPQGTKRNIDDLYEDDAIAVPVSVAQHSPSEDMDTNLPSTPIASPSGSSASTPSSAISRSPWSGKSTTTAYSSPPTTPLFDLPLRSKTSSPVRAPTKSTMSAPPETPTKRPPGLGTNMLTLVPKSAFQSLDMIGELKKMEVEIRLSRSIANAKRHTAAIAKQEATKPKGIFKQKPKPRVARRAPRPPPKIANCCPFEEESNDEDKVM